MQISAFSVFTWTSATDTIIKPKVRSQGSRSGRGKPPAAGSTIFSCDKEKKDEPNDSERCYWKAGGNHDQTGENLIQLSRGENENWTCQSARIESNCIILGCPATVLYHIWNGMKLSSKWIHETCTLLVGRLPWIKQKFSLQCLDYIILGT